MLQSVGCKESDMNERLKSNNSNYVCICKFVCVCVCVCVMGKKVGLDEQTA